MKMILTLIDYVFRHPTPSFPDSDCSALPPTIQLKAGLRVADAEHN
ncbi:hypothetical protein [Microcoleus sp. FACHB-68]|nr:hypothetical protein [Microcoleus sp. FACHB-68]MBD1939765.1 hypothetical protein [Microcoleus sp. FACHB-68]